MLLAASLMATGFATPVPGGTQYVGIDVLPKPAPSPPCTASAPQGTPVPLLPEEYGAATVPVFTDNVPASQPEPYQEAPVPLPQEYTATPVVPVYTDNVPASQPQTYEEAPLGNPYIPAELVNLPAPNNLIPPVTEHAYPTVTTDNVPAYTEDEEPCPETDSLSIGKPEPYSDLVLDEDCDEPTPSLIEDEDCDEPTEEYYGDVPIGEANLPKPVYPPTSTLPCTAPNGTPTPDVMPVGKEEMPTVMTDVLSSSVTDSPVAPEKSIDDSPLFSAGSQLSVATMGSGLAVVLTLLLVL